MEKLDMKRASDILADVPPEKSFQLKDGRSLKNLYELHEISSDMNDDTFSHHADGNDFGNWVRYVHKDEDLAKKLEEAKTQKEIQKFVRDRIAILHKIRGIKETTKAAKIKKIKTARPKRAEVLKKTTVKAKSMNVVPLKTASIRKVKAKRTKFPLKLTLGESKTAEKQLCSHRYFMKCSATHFLLGTIAGFLIGILAASI